MNLNSKIFWCELLGLSILVYTIDGLYFVKSFNVENIAKAILRRKMNIFQWEIREKARWT